MSSPPKTPGSAIPPFKQGGPRRRSSSAYVQSNANPIQPTPSSFGDEQSTFYSFPRLPDPEEDEAGPSQAASMPTSTHQQLPRRTSSVKQRIASGVRSLFGTTSEENKPLLNLTKEEYEAGIPQKTSDGANIFCQHILNEKCQCTVTMPIVDGRSHCQTCSDGECAAAKETAQQELRCAHHWLDTCQCARAALWVTGDNLCGPCWYGLCGGQKAEEGKRV